MPCYAYALQDIKNVKLIHSTGSCTFACCYDIIAGLILKFSTRTRIANLAMKLRGSGKEQIISPYLLFYTASSTNCRQ